MSDVLKVQGNEEKFQPRMVHFTTRDGCDRCALQTQPEGVYAEWIYDGMPHSQWIPASECRR